MQMSLQEYSALTTWFNKPTTDTTCDPDPKSIPGSHHRYDAVSADEYSPYMGHVAAPYDKEPMFEKPLTPSDVGKLNRLVVPKQNAEKYFPLGGGGGDAASGTHLGFEDEDGKWWQFRYSYWNSSQSYVLTKGWSRYVKEKRLEAGDVVLFHRHRGDPERMFIGSRRRGSAPQPAFPYNSQPFPAYQHQHDFSLQAATGGDSNTRRQVRLFGVTLDCQQLENSPSSSQTTSSESSVLSIQQQTYHSYFEHYHHM